MLINDGCAQWLWSDSVDSDDDHSDRGNNYGVICDDSDDDYDGWDDGGDDFVAVDDGGNNDRDDFCDSDEGINDHTGIVNL